MKMSNFRATQTFYHRTHWENFTDDLYIMWNRILVPINSNRKKNRQQFSKTASQQIPRKREIHRPAYTSRVNFRPIRYKWYFSKYRMILSKIAFNTANLLFGFSFAGSTLIDSSGFHQLLSRFSSIQFEIQ